MKVERYAQGDPWVGHIICPACAHLTPAWRSSGMSDSCPHFHCDRCSNALLREADKELLYAHPVDAGAVLVRDRLYSYQVRIDRPSWFARLVSRWRR